MGTFHQDRGELHGITVVVETRDGRLVAGRCNVADERAVVLWDADVAPAEEPARGAWLTKAASFGVWARHPTLSIPTAEVASIRRLVDLGP